MKTLLFTLLTSIALTTMVGCASPGQITETTNPVVSTNTFVSSTPVISVSPTGVTTTNVVTTTNTVTVTNMVTTLQTNWVANTTVTQFASTASSIAPVVSTVVPGPYGATAGLIIGLLGILGTAGAGAAAAYQNSKANQHKSTLQSVLIGIENALPGVHQAIATTTASGVVPSATQALTQADTVLSAVKSSITSAAAASGNTTNLNTQLAAVGAGPTAL